MEPNAVTITIGAVLLVLGAVGASTTQRRLEAEGRAATAPLWLAPFGVLIGGGAALIRGWDLLTSVVIGAVVVPVIGAVGRWLEVRSRARRRSADDQRG